MVQKLPQKDFQWMTREELDAFDINRVTQDDVTGYFLEVDVDYPKELHDLHQNLPFLCESKKSPLSGAHKLLTTLENKERYVVHYLTLKQAVEHGLKIKKIHRGIKFTQSNYLQPYINLNTEHRKNATNSFAKDFFKLANNALYGKLIEGVRKRINIKIETDWTLARKRIASPSFDDYKIMKENLVLFTLKKTKILFNKAIFAGVSILDQSKIVMYRFHYDIIVPKFGPNCVRILYCDTDSFFYHIFTQNFYQELSSLSEHLDTSAYPKDHFLFSDRSKFQN